MANNQIRLLPRSEISKFIKNPDAILNYEALQQQAFRALPDATDNAQAVADNAQAVANAAQPGDPTLTALAALDASLGLLEETAINTFTKRPIGVASATDIPTVGDADGRYVRQDQGSAFADWTGTEDRTTHASYTAPVISAGYVQAEVQAIADALQNVSRAMAALIANLRNNGTLP